MHGPTTGAPQLTVYVLAGRVAPAPMLSVTGSHAAEELCTSVSVVAVMPAPPPATAAQLPPAVFALRWSARLPVASTANEIGESRTFWPDLSCTLRWLG